MAVANGITGLYHAMCLPPPERRCWPDLVIEYFRPRTNDTGWREQTNELRHLHRAFTMSRSLANRAIATRARGFEIRQALERAELSTDRRLLLNARRWQQTG